MDKEGQSLIEEGNRLIGLLEKQDTNDPRILTIKTNQRQIRGQWEYEKKLEGVLRENKIRTAVGWVVIIMWFLLFLYARGIV